MLNVAVILELMYWIERLKIDLIDFNAAGDYYTWVCYIVNCDLSRQNSSYLIYVNINKFNLYLIF